MSAAPLRARGGAPLGRGAVAAVAALAACAGTGGSGAASGAAYRVTLRDFKSGNEIELRSESHTDHVELYSAARSSAGCKVQTDEVMEALVVHLRQLGFYDHDVAGRAPRAAGPGMASALEVLGPAGESYLMAGAGTPSAARAVHGACVRDFLLLYNETQAFQHVPNATGAAYFERGNALIKKAN